MSVKTASGISIMFVLLIKSEGAEVYGGCDDEGSGSSRSSPQGGKRRGFARRRPEGKQCWEKEAAAISCSGTTAFPPGRHQGPGLSLSSTKVQHSGKPGVDQPPGESKPSPQSVALEGSKARLALQQALSALC